MLKYNIKVDENFKEALSRKLDFEGIEPKFINELTGYYYKNAQLMDRFIRGCLMWVGEDEEVEGIPFLLSLLKIMELYRENVERWDGIVDLYIRVLEEHVRANYNSEVEYQPLKTETNFQIHSPLRGVYGKLKDMGLTEDFIDKFYLDGQFLQLYDDCVVTVTSLDRLNRTQRPSFIDLREGVFVIENRFQKVFRRMFMEKFEQEYGFYDCVKKTIKKVSEREINR